MYNTSAVKDRQRAFQIILYLSDMTINIMVSPVGAKVSLVTEFLSVESHLRYFNIFLGDSDSSAPALLNKRKIILTPSWNSPDWAAEFLRVCKKYDIHLIISLSDKELEKLATITDELTRLGVKTLLPARSGQEMLAVCGNKRMFVQWCKDFGFPIPITLAPGELCNGPDRKGKFGFPLFARPVRGESSKGAFRVLNEAMLASLSPWSEVLVVQEEVKDPEYSIDVLSNLEGESLQAIARKRVRIRGGEASTSEVVNNEVLERLAMAVCDSLSLVGHSVVQAFFSEEFGPRLIEVNPRFGGASTLSIRAGLDSPRRIIQMFKGDKQAYDQREVEYGLVMHRVSTDLFVRG